MRKHGTAPSGILVIFRLRADLFLSLATVGAALGLGAFVASI